MRRLIIEEDRLDHFLLASAGLPSTAIGAAPDGRAMQVAEEHGLDLRTKRARPITRNDFDLFELILALDSECLEVLKAAAPGNTARKVHRLLDFSPWIGEADIPDPTAGSPGDFSDVLDLIRLAVRGLLEALDQADGAFEVPDEFRVSLKVSSGT